MDGGATPDHQETVRVMLQMISHTKEIKDFLAVVLDDTEAFCSFHVSHWFV